MRRLRALEIGFVAERWIATRGAGHVLALFERSCYVMLPAGVVCLGGGSLGSGPLNLRTSAPPGLDWRTLGLSLGTLASCGHDKPGALTLGTQVTVTADGSTVWRPPTATPGSDRSIAEAVAALRGAARQVLAGADPLEGFVPLVLDTGNRDETPLLRAARRGLEDFAVWLRRSFRGGLEAAGPPPPRLWDLIGLGPGLTPSGDDLLCGALIALHGLGRRGEGVLLYGALEGTLNTATHAISRAHVRAAGEGAGSAALHDLLGDLLAGRQERLAERLRAIDGIGHSSGWDGLAGAVMVLLAWLDSRADRLDVA